MCYHVLEKGKFYKETIWKKSVWPEWDMKLHFLAEESVQSTAKNDRSAKALYSWKIMCTSGKEDKSNMNIYMHIWKEISSHNFCIPEWDMKLHFLAKERVQSTAKNDRSAKALYSWKIMCMCGKEYIYTYMKRNI